MVRRGSPRFDVVRYEPILKGIRSYGPSSMFLQNRRRTATNDRIRLLSAPDPRGASGHRPMTISRHEHDRTIVIILKILWVPETEGRGSRQGVIRRFEIARVIPCGFDAGTRGSSPTSVRKTGTGTDLSAACSAVKIDSSTGFSTRRDPGRGSHPIHPVTSPGLRDTRPTRRRAARHRWPRRRRLRRDRHDSRRTSPSR